MPDGQAGSGGVSVFAVPNAHIDPVWIWDWREGMREVVATFSAAADRLEENEDLCFVASSAAYYAWVEEMDPVLFSRIQGHVASGRWELVGGEWVEPDCNLPSGESVCRQLLYAQRYLHAAFGRTALVAYNIDSFGHAGSLPQLFAKAGLGSYVMMRPQEHERSIPASLFLWEGIDGTSILTYRIHEAYTTSVSSSDGIEPGAREEELIDRRAGALLELAARQMTPGMLFVGVGDHGGGPTKAAIRRVRQLGSTNDGAVAFSTTKAFFDACSDRAAVMARLPRVAGDLHMHAVGCYSVVSWIKEANAASEQALETAEKMASLCQMTTGIDLGATTKLRDAWLRVLFNQFHDSLGGTCTQEAFADLRELYGYARTIADEITTKATQLIAARADTSIEGAKDLDRHQSANPFVAHYPVPVVVFNPLSFAVTVPVEMAHPAKAATTSNGAQLLVQGVVSREGTRYEHHAVLVAELPPLGARVYFLHREAPLAAPASTKRPAVPTQVAVPAPVEAAVVSATEESIESEHLVVRLDSARGRVASIVSRATEREWLAAEGLRPVVLEDPSDTWSHGVARYDAEEQECTFVAHRLLEAGPLRAKLRLTYHKLGSMIYLDVIVHAGFDYVDLLLHVDWHERHQLLKLVVPLAIESPEITAGVPYGRIARSASGEEEVMAHWLEVEEHGTGSGVTCSSVSTYAYDATSSRIRLSVLRSPRYADHGASWTTNDAIDQPATDQGWHSVAYRLHPHDGVAASPARLAAEHCASFPVVTETWHEGQLGSVLAGMDLRPENVVATVLKRAEDGTGWIVRLVETEGHHSFVHLGLDLLGRAFDGSIEGFEVKTLLLPDDPSGEICEVAITELDHVLRRAGERAR